MQTNRILTDDDRLLYKNVIDLMYALLPMSGHKIQDAMVQEAFVYHTAASLFSSINARILSAGSYHDVAAELLRYDGYAVYDVDPVINYTLHEFMKRDNRLGLYDAVISTSVLEHTTDDEEFLSDCCSLLKHGGYGIFTMDFKDDWVVGQPVPYTSNRFYTRQDLEVRLRNVLLQNQCDIVDLQDYSQKDRFVWDGINYSFATFVFRKDTT